MLILLMISTNVLAEWTKTETRDNGNSTVYIDFGTIKRKVNKVKMWILNDYKTVIKGEYNDFLSTLIHFEYDCEEDTRRMLDYYNYSENMGGGYVVSLHTNINDEPISIPPVGIETNFKIACGKK